MQGGIPGEEVDLEISWRRVTHDPWPARLKFVKSNECDQTMLTLFVLAQLVVGEVCATSFAFSAEPTQGEAEAPVYKRGESWTYRAVTKRFNGTTSRNLLNGEYQITLVPGRRLFFKIEGDRPIEEKNPDFLVVMLPTRAVINHTARYFQFPLAVGKKWNTNYFNEGYRQWISPEAAVTGVESVTTPAGTFSAYRIERLFSYSRTFTGIGEAFGIYVKEIYFYSPQVRSVVNLHYQLDYQSTGDLVPGITVDIEVLKSHQE